MTRLTRAATLVTLLAAVGPAHADHDLPATTQRYVLVADGALVTGQGDIVNGENGKPAGCKAYRVEATHSGLKQAWDVDLFWLADRIDSNLICAGDHEGEMRRYLARLATPPQDGARPKTLVIEIVATDKPGLFVAGVWAFDADAAWKLACEHGSRLSNLTAEQAKALGSTAAYEKRVRDTSEADWKRLEATMIGPGPGAAPGGPPGGR